MADTTAPDGTSYDALVKELTSEKMQFQRSVDPKPIPCRVVRMRRDGDLEVVNLRTEAVYVIKVEVLRVRRAVERVTPGGRRYRPLQWIELTEQDIEVLRGTVKPEPDETEEKPCRTRTPMTSRKRQKK